MSEQGCSAVRGLSPKGIWRPRPLAVRDLLAQVCCVRSRSSGVPLGACLQLALSVQTWLDSEKFSFTIVISRRQKSWMAPCALALDQLDWPPAVVASLLVAGVVSRVQTGTARISFAFTGGCVLRGGARIRPPTRRTELPPLHMQQSLFNGPLRNGLARTRARWQFSQCQSPRTLENTE